MKYSHTIIIRPKKMKIHPHTCGDFENQALIYTNAAKPTLFFPKKYYLIFQDSFILPMVQVFTYAYIHITVLIIYNKLTYI